MIHESTFIIFNDVLLNYFYQKNRLFLLLLDDEKLVLLLLIENKIFMSYNFFIFSLKN